MPPKSMQLLTKADNRVLVILIQTFFEAFCRVKLHKSDVCCFKEGCLYFFL